MTKTERKLKATLDQAYRYLTQASDEINHAEKLIKKIGCPKRIHTLKQK